MNTVISHDGTTIAYDKIGTGSSLILVDPVSGFRGFGPMASLSAHLTPHFTVYTYDRRGRGDSTDTLPYSVDREVNDLQVLIDAAGGSALVYGFSSGAVLALRAAERGLAIQKLALLKPPLASGNYPPADSNLKDEIAGLVAEGRRGDAVEVFQMGIGVPAEMTTGMRQAPF
jgi:pimeloyl-ACP methyl ester carboxylesterase